MRDVVWMKGRRNKRKYQQGRAARAGALHLCVRWTHFYLEYLPRLRSVSEPWLRFFILWFILPFRPASYICVHTSIDLTPDDTETSRSLQPKQGGCISMWLDIPRKVRGWKQVTRPFCVKVVTFETSSVKVQPIAESSGEWKYQGLPFPLNCWSHFCIVCWHRNTVALPCDYIAYFIFVMCAQLRTIQPLITFKLSTYMVFK